MSFGSSIGDFIEIGKFAYNLWEGCSNAPGDYNEIAQLCRNISIALDSCRPNDPHTILHEQQSNTIKILTTECKTTLEELQSILNKHENLTPAKNLGQRIGFYGTKGQRQIIRSRLQEYLATIQTFLTGVQVERSELIARLVFQLHKTKAPEDENKDSILSEDTSELRALLKELGSRSEVLEEELAADQSAIMEKLVEKKKQAVNSKTSSTTSGILNTSGQPSLIRSP